MTYDPQKEAQRAARAARWIDRLTIFQLVVLGVPAALFALLTLGCCGYAVWAIAFT